jgi:hypothetical protein
MLQFPQKLEPVAVIPTVILENNTFKRTIPVCEGRHFYWAGT